MFVDFGTLEIGQIQNLARVKHGAGEVGGFLRRHAPEVHGHREGRHLIVGDLAPRVARDEELDFGLGQGVAVALALQDVGNSQPSRSARIHFTSPSAVSFFSLIRPRVAHRSRFGFGVGA